MKHKYSKSLIPLIGQSVMLTVIVTVCFVAVVAIYGEVERKNNMVGFVSTATLFATAGTIFGGVVAALAIHNSFRQSAREKRFELRIGEHKKTVETAAGLVGKSIAVNTLPKLQEIPNSAEAMTWRKQAVSELYGFVERNYTDMMVSGALFEIECRGQENKELKRLEAQTARSQKEFADRYRQLYHKLHDYMNHFLTSMETLYRVSDSSGNMHWIWESDMVCYIEQWELQTNRPFIKELIEASQAQDELLDCVTRCAVETRDALTVFSEDFKELERLALLYSRSATDVEFDSGKRLQAYKDDCARHPIP